MLKLGKEPVAMLAIANAVLNAVQIAAVPMPTWAHTVMAVLLIAIAAALSRAGVTPVVDPVPAPTPVSPTS